MGIVAYRLNSLNGDGRRQEVIEPCTKISRYRFLNIKMRYHLLCMYTGIGSSGKRQRHGLAQDGSKSSLHLGLHRVPVRLALRTVEIGTVI